MSSVIVLQTALPTNTTSITSSTTPTSSATTTLGPFQAGGKAPVRKPAPINPLAQSCQKCGADLTHSHLAEDSQRRIAELEAQVKILTTKATAAVDKLADYEDELRRLKSTPQTPITPTDTNPPDSSLTATPRQQQPPSRSHPIQQQSAQQQTADRSRLNRSPSPTPPAASTSTTTTPTQTPLPLQSSPQPPPPAPQAEKPPPRPTAASRLTSLLPSASIRRSNPNNSPLPSPLPPDLQALLTREQTLRLAAERRVTQTNSELEELSAQLFTEANEMVATERKARARLEERVVVLEKREREKAGRLEVLEKRVGRVERVRGILAQSGNVGTGGVG